MKWQSDTSDAVAELTGYQYVHFDGVPRSSRCATTPIHRSRPRRYGIGERNLSVAEQDALELAGWVLAQSGLDWRNYRVEPLLRRIPACLRALHVKDVESARRLLEGSPALIPTAVNALIIGVSSFFRDAVVFDLLPEQLRQLGATRSRLRIWSAGCSDGSELYSVAMLLHELGLLESSELLGTDCRAEAIDVARAGCYNTNQTNQVAQVVERYGLLLHKVGGSAVRIASRLRRKIEWRQQELFTNQPNGPWDVILCRNVVIYLQPAAASRLWSSMVSALSPGGLLVVGKAERVPAQAGLMRVESCLYRKSWNQSMPERP